jgi:hypothetical protein
MVDLCAPLGRVIDPAWVTEALVDASRPPRQGG